MTSANGTSSQRTPLLHSVSMYCTPLIHRIPACQKVKPFSLHRSRILGEGIEAAAVVQGPHPQLRDELTAYLYRTTAIRNQRASPKTPGSITHSKMAFLLPGLRRGLLLSTPFILSAPLLVHAHRRPILCDGPDPLTKITSDLTNRYASEAQTPIIKQSGAANPRAVRQISMGSIFGVLAGLGVSVFSKPLAILIGLGIVCLQVRTRLDVPR
jgi:hypothetical protein